MTLRPPPVARARTPALAAVSVALALLGPPAPARAAGTGPWTAAPAAGTADARRAGDGGAPAAGGRASFYVEGAPGTVSEDRLSVVNPGERPQTVELRATGPWISLAAPRVSVPPRTRADVPLTVAVPAGQPPGAHLAAVVATAPGREVRVPVAVRVSGPALSALSVEHLRVTGAGRGTEIHYALVNRGNTTLAPRLAIRGEGLFGEVLRTAPRTAPAELPPGARVRLTERWPDAPRLDRVRIGVTATAPDGTRAAASATYAPLPWLPPVLAGAGGLAVAALAVRLLRRRRARS
ncbi:hypothetical protein BLA24_16185 [Streptomyces cinnamoneus]|uniref:DUF916 domain-containing protein n=1 Tax=Streptomyces cinnamoneus TaxID=53446 RepID=A0A2G1XJ83_STRCJ|nr:hypothetical protein [Streptomyces cinnamoneus]PHQ51283.1 hypothetical protein BLA24_16185 [Streptomyces cinnamoneus]PPT13492.1 hypothetical protein CYQ11_11890 [Streptomyces cinnamoneus]